MILKASSISSSLSSVLQKEEKPYAAAAAPSRPAQRQNLISDPKQTAPTDYFAALLSLRNLYLNSTSFSTAPLCIIQSLNLSTLTELLGKLVSSWHGK